MTAPLDAMRVGLLGEHRAVQPRPRGPRATFCSPTLAQALRAGSTGAGAAPPSAANHCLSPCDAHGERHLLGAA